LNTHEVRLLTATINVPLDEAYGFAHNPENFPQWASGLSKTLHKTEKGWVAETQTGEATVRFTEPNPYGILDHWVTLGDNAEIYIPLRLIANGEGTEVELTLLRQPEMDDDAFDRDAEVVMNDLLSLKKLLEHKPE